MVCMVILELQEKPGGRGEVMELIADFLPVTRQRDGYIEILTLANTETQGVAWSRNGNRAHITMPISAGGSSAGTSTAS